MRRTSPGLARTRRPTRQNVAFTSCAFNMSSSLGVYVGSGPSSKVNATSGPPVVIDEPAGPLPPATGRFAGVTGTGGGGGGGVVGDGVGPAVVGAGGVEGAGAD